MYRVGTRYAAYNFGMEMKIEDLFIKKRFINIECLLPFRTLQFTWDETFFSWNRSNRLSKYLSFHANFNNVGTRYLNCTQKVVKKRIFKDFDKLKIKLSAYQAKISWEQGAWRHGWDPRRGRPGCWSRPPGWRGGAPCRRARGRGAAPGSSPHSGQGGTPAPPSRPPAALAQMSGWCRSRSLQCGIRSSPKHQFLSYLKAKMYKKFGNFLTDPKLEYACCAGNPWEICLGWKIYLRLSSRHLSGSANFGYTDAFIFWRPVLYNNTE